MTDAGTIKAIHPVAANLQRLSSQRIRKLKQLLRPTLVIKNQQSHMSSKPTQKQKNQQSHMSSKPTQKH